MDEKRKKPEQVNSNETETFDVYINNNPNVGYQLNSPIVDSDYHHKMPPLIKPSNQMVSDSEGDEYVTN